MASKSSPDGAWPIRTGSKAAWWRRPGHGRRPAFGRVGQEGGAARAEAKRGFLNETGGNRLRGKTEDDSVARVCCDHAVLA